jgi:hypothetical protein
MGIWLNPNSTTDNNGTRQKVSHGRAIQPFAKFCQVAVCRGKPPDPSETSFCTGRLIRTKRVQSARGKETPMKRMFLITIATAALAVPAFAQQSPASQYELRSQAGSNSRPPSQSSKNQDQISPQRLSASQIREIQQSLDNKGFKSGSVDGAWGPRTEAALKNFQKSQNMSSFGEVNSNTLAGLGLNNAEFGLGASRAETTGQAPSGGSSRGNITPHNDQSGAMNPSSQSNLNGSTSNQSH